MAKREVPKPSTDEQEPNCPRDSEREHHRIETILQLSGGDRGEEGQRDDECEHCPETAAIYVERIARNLHDGIAEHPEIIDADEPNARRHQHEIKGVEDRGGCKDKNCVSEPLQEVRMNMRTDRTVYDHDKAGEKSADLIEVKFAR